ncbi:hypothetical protein [Roseivivax isoporae]|uniref:Uncharacterized protein n=1 Tax=Roseivivax isoporae LMG 25204 TaxID=1449351 RepID=X7F8F5_9RHOB|nr:hypothetical protein [Roseivivax isoporae]ETX29055.1 hypothetical protein RISW2_03680 [Roseivivax isoporae LMG 25204]
MKAFLTGAAVAALGAGLTFVGLVTFDQSTAERYQDGSVILLDHATSWDTD